MRTIRHPIGLAVIGLGITFNSLFSTIILDLLGIKLSTASEFSRYSDTNIDIVVSRGGRGTPVAHIRVTHPEAVRANETKQCKIEYWNDWFGSDRDIEAALYSASFDIAPANILRKPKGITLPVVFTWTITPKREGRHQLLLDLTNLAAMPDARTKMDLFVNTKLIPGSRVDAIPLPVTVYTIWGISEVTFNLLRYCSALVGLIMAYPLFISFLKRRLHLTDAS